MSDEFGRKRLRRDGSQRHVLPKPCEHCYYVSSMLLRTISSQVLRPFVRSFAEIVAEKPLRHPNSGSRLRRRQARIATGPKSTGPKLIAGPTTPPSESLPTTELPKSKQTLIQKLPVREDHGLYAFFRRKPDDTLKGENRFEVFETPETYQLSTGMFVSRVKYLTSSLTNNRQVLVCIGTAPEKLQRPTYTLVHLPEGKEFAGHPKGRSQKNGSLSFGITSVRPESAQCTCIHPLILLLSRD